MIKVDELLSPISSEDPCGTDLSYDPAFQELDSLIGGKPETQFSEAEEPNWKQVHQHCVTLFGRTKDLRGKRQGEAKDSEEAEPHGTVRL